MRFGIPAYVLADTTWGSCDLNSNGAKVLGAEVLFNIGHTISMETMDDNVVDIRYSRNFNSILDKTSIPHELNEYASGGHNFTGSTFTQAMDAAIEFYKKYLEPQSQINKEDLEVILRLKYQSFPVPRDFQRCK